MGLQITPVAPLGSLSFRVTFRSLPAIISIQLQAKPAAQEAQLQEAVQKAQCLQQASSLHKLVTLHAELQAAVQGQARIHFSGVDTGKCGCWSAAICLCVDLVDAAGSPSILHLPGQCTSRTEGKR